ncbi:MAG TPA: SdpI family protein [Chitinophagaceae bacterium]|nr:SdpI family protein [Chitinophagaceae bacterium]
MKSIRKKIVWPIIAAPAVYLALIWNKLPETIALHFDLKGDPDRFGNKNEIWVFVGVLMIVNILVYLLLINIHRFDPKKQAIDNKERMGKIAFAVVIFLSAITCLLLYSSWVGSIKFSVGIIFSATGLLFAVIGNYLPNLKPNYFAGLRLPWTLENADNWKKTHLLAGKLWFAGGILIAVTCLFLSTVPAIIVFFAVMLVITVIPCVYSYRLFKDQKMVS